MPLARGDGSRWVALGTECASSLPPKSPKQQRGDDIATLVGAHQARVWSLLRHPDLGLYPPWDSNPEPAD